MKYTFQTTLLKEDESNLMWYWRVNIPAEFVSQLLQADKRIICSLNGLKPYHAALTSDGQGSHFVIVNKERRKKLGIDTGDTVTVEIEKDMSKYGMAVPEAFTELCYQDPEGNEVFHSLTPGKQRTLLHLMGKPKSEQKQLEKTLVVFDYLKSVNGKLDFKELNEAFKNNRFKL